MTITAPLERIKPLTDQILIEREILENQTDWGLILPEGAEDRKYPEAGKVLAIGPDVRGVSVGDRLLFSRYAGTEITLDRTDYLIAREEEVLAIADADAKVTWDKAV